MIKKIWGYSWVILIFAGCASSSQTSGNRWKQGILTDEFIYTQAPFPQAHAATIAETPEGLIAAWFGGTREGNKDVEIWISHLQDGKWAKPVSVADGILNDTTRYACYNPVLYQVPGGELILFYKIGPNVAGWTGWLKRSKDNGHTWGAREAIPEGFLGPIKNKPVVIGDELFCPSSTEKNGWKVHFEVTKDNGRTWRKIGPINDGVKVNAIQPSIIKYNDKTYQVLCRTRQMGLGEAWSYDAGQSWTDVSLSSAMPNNNSGTDAVTLHDGRQLLVYNHVLPDSSWVKGKGPRTPLNVALSKDGKQWFAALVLEDSPISQYSYPSVIQSKDGMVHIVYTWRRERIKYVKIDPKKLKLTEIKNKQWPGAIAAKGKVTDD